MKNIFILAAVLILCGCAMPQAGIKPGGGLIKKRSAESQPQSRNYVDETVDVITAPSGARIQVNGSSAGYAPVSVPVRRLWRGEPGRMVLDTVTIEALPTGPGQCAQSGIFGEGSRKVASPVRFNMADCSAAQPDNGRK